MPIYDFRCPECYEEYHDVFLSIDHDEQRCELCDSKLAYIIQSNIGMHFEGSGWTMGAGLDRRKV